MPHALLHVLRYFLLGFLWLFFLYAVRMVFVEIRRSKVERMPASPLAPLGSDQAVSLKLKVVDPPQRRGRVYELGEEVTLGRSSGCAVPLEDDSFTSSVHARVFQRGGELWLEDLGSTNGTWLNEERVNDGPMRLQRGDRMKVGSTTLEVTR
ncbi:MAG: FHA domain-containing protein [Acidimicrobiales bacterium]